MGDRRTIIGLVVHAMRGWAMSDEVDAPTSAPGTCVGGVYSVFYIDAERPREIQMQGALANRCHMWIEPADVRSGVRGVELLVDVTVIHQRDGAPAVTEFQVALDEDLKPLVH
jgi:hypothetical protein